MYLKKFGVSLLGMIDQESGENGHEKRLINSASFFSIAFRSYDCRLAYSIPCIEDFIPA